MRAYISNMVELPKTETLPERKPPNSTSVMAQMFLGQFLFLAIGGLLIALEIPEPFGLFIPGADDLAVGAICLALMIGLALAIINFMPRLMADLEDHIIELYDKFGLKLTWPLILALSLAAGICEELFFRAGLMAGLENFDIPPLLIWLGSSTLFGLCHATSRLYFLWSFLIGLILGAAYMLTGSLIGPILAHFIYDIWALARLRGRLYYDTHPASPASQSP